MYQRQIMQAIAERLTVKGNCPADPGCIYAGADSCTAPADILEAKLTQTEKVMREQTGGLVVRNTLNSSSWPCGDLLAVVFADPHDRSKVYRIWEKSKRET